MTEPDAGSTGPGPGPPHMGGRDPAVAWATWESGLADAVMSLADGEALTVTAGPRQARPVLVRAGFLRGFVPAKHEESVPWARLVRVEDHVRGTCVGAESFGGRFPFAPEEDEALVALGWRRPGPGNGTDYLRFWPDDVPQGPFLPRDEAERVAAMVTRTFRTVLSPPSEMDPSPPLPVVTPG